MLGTRLVATSTQRSGTISAMRFAAVPLSRSISASSSAASTNLRRFTSSSSSSSSSRYTPASSRWQHSSITRASSFSSSSFFIAPRSSRLFSSAPTPSSDPSKHAVTVHGTSSDTALAPANRTWREKGAVLWQKAKAEGRHYWLGTKLLWAEIKIAVRLCRQIAQGHELTRRERKQLLRTSADLVRMVPFVVILVVPFSEFALPFLLKFFPNMLPSTYLDSTGAEAKLQKQLLVKMEMARFLQETTHLLAQQLATKKNLSNEEALIQASKFRDFMEKVRTGKKVLNSDIVGFSKLFDSELTLENLNKEQLSAMCRLLDIKVFGSLWVLRYKLQEKLRGIQKDDVMIEKEGVDALSESELRTACRERGIYTGPEKDIAYLKRKLSDWLELSLQHQVPVTLLLLSRAFSRQMTRDINATTETLAIEKSGAHAEPEDLSHDLATTLAHVPTIVIAEAEKEIVDLTDDKEAKLKSIEEEAIEQQYEEIRARKEGKEDTQTRQTKIKTMKTAIGVTQEKLQKLQETNVNVGDMIDRTVDEEKEEELKKAQLKAKLPAATASATTTAIPASSTTVPVASTPATSPSVAKVDPTVVASTTVDTSIEKKKDSKKKTIQAVDKLNDRVGAILAEINAQTARLEALQREKAEAEAALKQASRPVEPAAKPAEKQA